MNVKDRVYNRPNREMRRRHPDWRMRPRSVDGRDNTTRSERGPLGSGGDVVVGSFAHGGEATPGALHRRRAEQTQWVIGGMAGSALTSAPPRKALYRTERCPTLEAVPWENPTYGILGRAAGNVAHGGTVNPPCNRKGRDGNPPPTSARAGALPDRMDRAIEHRKSCPACRGHRKGRRQHRRHRHDR